MDAFTALFPDIDSFILTPAVTSEENPDPCVEFERMNDPSVSRGGACVIS
uniref:Putative pheromone n=1 Tax=Flammulina velutipes TaxID=38945 RepID=M4MCJ3_FLAVE|nr:putative pheromone precursor [Flammulina velutipes]